MIQAASTNEGSALARARLAFLSSRKGTQRFDGVPELIADSWVRSARAGVDPGGGSVPWRDFDADSFLARCAREPLEALVRSLGSLEVGVVLADEHARVIARLDADRSATTVLNAIDLAPGFDFGEDVIGTNGVGSVIPIEQSVYVSGAAHFQGRLTGYVCAGAPILHPLTGRLEGVLDLTAATAMGSPLMRSLAEQTARIIEHRLLEQVSRIEHVALDAFTEASNDARSTHPSMLVVAAAQQVRLRNRVAERALGETGTVQLLSRARAEARRGSQEFVVDLPGGEGTLIALRARAELLAADAGAHARSGAGDDAGVGILVRAEVIDVLKGDSGSDSGRARARRSGGAIHAEHELVDQIEFGGRMRSGSWQLARRDLGRTLRQNFPVLVYGEVGTGKISLIREVVERVRPGSPVLTVAAEEVGSGGSVEGLISRKAQGLMGARRIAPDALPILILRNVQRMTGARRAEALRIVRTSRCCGSRALIIITAESMDEGGSAEIDEFLPHISHAVGVPALRFRRDDFPRIVQRILDGLQPGAFARLAPEALGVLASGHWPGNLHQLADALRCALQARPEGSIRVEDLPEHARHTALRPLTLLEREERNTMIGALYRAGGNRSAAARALGISRATLYRRLASYGLEMA